ncbi:MAG: hypothetical protein HKP30_09435 [Myxococcales bacterium]|nr:hypothetical protein [Myxococcales bacterium]
MPTPSEIESIRLFLKKGVIFVVPFLLYAAFLVVIDPFTYFNVSHVIDHENKRETAGKLHYALWKSLVFRHDPRPNVFFGDSRMALFRVSIAEELTGEPFYNFSYGAGTIPEMVDTFWFADQHVELERVFFGIGIINYNVFQSMNRVVDSNAILGNPLLYLTNRIVSKAAFYAVAAQLTGSPADIEKPPLAQEAFWRYQLGEPTTANFGLYKRPTEYLARLREVAEYCAEQGIAFTIVIPPSHVDLQAKVAEFDMQEEYDRFLEDMRSLGRVIDFNFPNPFTRDRANFSDPYHFQGANPRLVEAILSDAPDPTITR